MRRRVEVRQGESAKNKQIGQTAQEKTIQVKENFYKSSAVCGDQMKTGEKEI